MSKKNQTTTIKNPLFKELPGQIDSDNEDLELNLNTYQQGQQKSKRKLPIPPKANGGHYHNHHHTHRDHTVIPTQTQDKNDATKEKNIIVIIDEILKELFDKNPAMKGLSESMGKYYRMRIVLDLVDNLDQDSAITKYKKFKDLQPQDFEKISTALIKAVKKRVHIARKANEWNLAFNALNLATMAIFDAPAYYGTNILNCDEDTENDFFASFKQQPIIPSIIAIFSVVMTSSSLIQQDSGNHCAEVVFGAMANFCKKVFLKMKDATKQQREQLIDKLIESAIPTEKEEIKRKLEEFDEKLEEIFEQKGQSKEKLKNSDDKQEFHESLRFRARFITGMTFILSGVGISNNAAILIANKAFDQETLCQEEGFLESDESQFMVNFMPKAITLMMSLARNISNKGRESAFFGIAQQVQCFINIAINTAPLLGENFNIQDLILEIADKTDLSESTCSHHHHHHHHHDHHDHEQPGIFSRVYEYLRIKNRNLYGNVMWLVGHNPLARLITGDNNINEEKYQRALTDISSTIINQPQINETELLRSASKMLATNNNQSGNTNPTTTTTFNNTKKLDQSDKILVQTEV